MAYYSGSAVDMAAVRTALVNACIAEGWSWNAGTEMLSKGLMFLRLQVTSGYLAALGRTSAGAGDAPGVVRIGQIGITPITFPASYEIFVFPDEVYLVVNHSVDFYQWMAFGLSSISGLTGSGMWLGASIGASNDSASSGVYILATVGGAIGPDRTPAALFWSTIYPTGVQVANRNCFVNSGLDGEGWLLNNAGVNSLVGALSCAPLIGLLPSSWNSEAVLLPIRAFKARPSNKISLVADLQNARYTRVDNYSPGQIVTVGDEQWKIFPWYRKDSANRNGFSASSGVAHSGTFGWAIRYEEP